MYVNEAAAAIMKILNDLPTPRHAAAALAVVRANLHTRAGGNTTAKVLKMISDDDKATLEIWNTINKVGMEH